MQVKKSYTKINPELLYDEVRDLVQKYGGILAEAKMQTYSLPGASSHIVRGTIVCKTKQDKAEKECLRAHIVGTAAGETKMMLDADESLFPEEKIKALEADLDFVFGSYQED
ncbi:hypothetical protein ACFLTS_04965 [Chloroflexota bacterium]